MVQPDAEGYCPEGRHNRVVVGELKTARSKRTLYLARLFWWSLFELMVSVNLKKGSSWGAAWSDYGVICSSTTGSGTPYDPDDFRHEFGRLCAKAGIVHRSPRELRHSGASLVLAQGTQLHVASEVLGHSSIKVTKDVSGHWSGKSQTLQRHVAGALRQMVQITNRRGSQMEVPHPTNGACG
jgi:integrase